MAKSKKAPAKCSKRGCRRVAREGEFCLKCAPKNKPIDPLDAAKRLSALELARLGKLGAELQNSMLQLRLSQYELKEMRAQAELQIQEALRAKDQERQQRAEELQHARRQYDQLTLELSKKYGVSDPKKMVVDTETGIIHDASSM